jgi:hypothetical protein
VITLTASQLSVLLDGLHWRKVAPRAVDRCELDKTANLLRFARFLSSHLRMIRFNDLPSNPLLLKQKLIETTSIIAKVSAEKVALADERNVAIAQRDSALQENEKLLLILSQYKRALFGRRSEKMDADQLQPMFDIWEG